MDKKNNNTLALGVTLLIFGMALLAYCLSSYFEIKTLENKIDFINLEDNKQISTNDKDFLLQKLKKNKNLPIKNSSCAYLDYAQHNILDMYTLIFKGVNEDAVKKDVVEGNTKTLLSIYDNYK